MNSQTSIQFLQVNSSASRTVTAGDLTAGVVTCDFTLHGSATPILDLDSGLSLSGISLVEEANPVLSAYDGSEVFLRSSGGADLKHEDPGAPAAQRFSISTGTDLIVDPRGVVARYSVADSRWLVEAPRVAGDYDTFQIINTSTVAGATLEAALDALGSVSDVVEVTPAFVLGNAPAYTTFKTFPVAEGQSILVEGWLHLTVGPDTALLSSGIRFFGVARRSVAGTTSISAAVTSVTGSIGGLTIQWATSGNDAVINLRSTAGNTTRITFSYRLVSQGI